MMSEVRTIWHKIVDAVRKDRVQVITDVDMSSGRIYSKPKTDKLDVFERLVREKRDTPHFVIAESVSNMVTSLDQWPAYNESMRALKRVDAMHLPYNSVFIECKYAKLDWCVYVHERSPKQLLEMNEASDQFVAFVMGYSKEYDLAMTFGHTVSIGWAEVDGEFDSVFKVHKEYGIDTKECHEMSANIAMSAIFTAIIMINMRGVTKEVVTPEVKLNKARVKGNKEPIPRYTYIKVGRVTYRDGSEHTYDETIHRRMHLRRGHIRNQRFGPNLQYTKPVYIEPIIVNYDPNETPATPTYKVTS